MDKKLTADPTQRDTNPIGSLRTELHSFSQGNDNSLKYANLYRSFTSSTMCYQLCERYQLQRLEKGRNLGPYSQKQFAFILFADISGFTRLSNSLSADDLKQYINEYFTMLIAVINNNNGDIIKFCGDALIIMWPFSPDVDEGGKRAGAIFACLCALQLLSECDNYIRQVPGSDTVVRLRLHCGISCGIVHCMYLGELQRWEFVVSGAPIKEIGAALSAAEAGSVCITSNVHELIDNILVSLPVPKAIETSSASPHMAAPPADAYLLTGSLHFLSAVAVLC